MVKKLISEGYVHNNINTLEEHEEIIKQIHDIVIKIIDDKKNKKLTNEKYMEIYDKLISLIVNKIKHKQRIYGVDGITTYYVETTSVGGDVKHGIGEYIILKLDDKGNEELTFNIPNRTVQFKYNKERYGKNKKGDNVEVISKASRRRMNGFNELSKTLRGSYLRETNK